jgi:hypothetical protein
MVQANEVGALAFAAFRDSHFRIRPEDLPAAAVTA